MSEDEKIAELNAKIAELERRQELQEIRQSPLKKDFDRFKKHAEKFIQSCIDNGRQDVANSVLGVVNVTRRQVEETIAG